MKILAMEHEVPGVPKEHIEPHLKAEAKRVWELCQTGVIREIHFREDKSRAVLMLECESGDAAREALDTLPLVQAGLIRFEVIPLAPYPGLARLFG